MTTNHTSVTDAENAQYKDMFFAAVSALAEIDGLLGLPEDGCNDPQITVSALKDYMAGAQEGSNALLSNDEIFNIAQYYIGQKDGEFDYTGFARAVIAQSRQPSSEAVELPPLPEPISPWYSNGEGYQNIYSDGQMREYATAAIKAAHPQPAAPAGPNVWTPAELAAARKRADEYADWFLGKPAGPVGGQGEVESVYKTRLRGVLRVIQDYLPPDGIDAKEALSKIIPLVDPWPVPTPTPSVDAEMVKDAERYREWRRAFREGICALWNSLSEAQSIAEHDAAIDAAIAAHKGMRK